MKSIGQALFLLGIEPIRRWASVWCLAGLSADATPELGVLALLRARTCELVGESIDDVDSSELFLVGLFSLLDAMLGKPMSAALGHLPLSEDAVDALLGRPNRLRSILTPATSHERGDGNGAIKAATDAGVSPSVLADAHTGKLRWVQDVTRNA